MAVSMKAGRVMKAKRVAASPSKLVKNMLDKSIKAKTMKGKMDKIDKPVKTGKKLVKSKMSKGKVGKIAKVAKSNKKLDEKQIQGQRKAELQAMKLAELEPLHLSKGLATASVKELAAKAKLELSSKQVAELKEACGSKSLLVSGTKDDLVKRLVGASQEELRSSMVVELVAFEAREREAARAKDAKVREVVANMKKEKSVMPAQELKAALLQKGLKTGGSKTEMVQRLIVRAREEGEVDRTVAFLAREAKREELLSMNKDTLIDLCTKSGVDPIAKEVMVDRLLLKL